MATDCPPGEEPLQATGPKEATYDVDIGNVDAEIDVLPSGSTSVARCDAVTGEPVDLIFLIDADKDGTIKTTDPVGYIDGSGAFTAGPYPGALGKCGCCPTIGDPETVMVDGVTSTAVPVRSIDPNTGEVSTSWVDPITGEPVTGTVTKQTCGTFTAP